MFDKTISLAIARYIINILRIRGIAAAAGSLGFALTDYFTQSSFPFEFISGALATLAIQQGYGAIKAKKNYEETLKEIIDSNDIRSEAELRKIDGSYL